VARMVKIRNTHSILVSKSPGKRPVWRWEDNIMIELRR